MKKIRNTVIVTVMSLVLGLASAACGEQVRLETGKEAAGQEERKTEAGETTEKAETAEKADGTADEAGSRSAAGAADERTGTGERTAGETAAQTGTQIAVHVCGAVANPGVYRLPEGSRAEDAVRMAGGMTGDAAADYLNLAGVLADGEKLVVPYRSEIPEGGQYGSDGFGQAGSAGVSGEADTRIDLNHADQAALMTLPGIGEARAAAILAYRESHGPFQSPEEIMNVSGIKQAAYEKLKDQIVVR